MTTTGATSDDKVGMMTTLCHHWLEIPNISVTKMNLYITGLKLLPSHITQGLMSYISRKENIWCYVLAVSR